MAERQGIQGHSFEDFGERCVLGGWKVGGWDLGGWVGVVARAVPFTQVGVGPEFHAAPLGA